MFHFIFNDIYMTNSWFYNYNIIYINDIYLYDHLYYINLNYYDLNYLFINYNFSEYYMFYNNLNLYKTNNNIILLYIYYFWNLFIIYWYFYGLYYLSIIFLSNIYYINLLLYLLLLLLFILYNIYFLNIYYIIYLKYLNNYYKIYINKNKYLFTINYYKYLYNNQNININYLLYIYNKYLLNKQYLYDYYYENYYIPFKIITDKYYEIIKTNILTYKIFGVYFTYISYIAILRDDLRLYKRKIKDDIDREEKIKKAEIYYFLESYKFFMINIILATIYRIILTFIKIILYLFKYMYINKLYQHIKYKEFIKLKNYIYIYIYLSLMNIINKQLMNKFFIIQEYILYEYIINIYDLINTWILIFLEFINSFFIKKFNTTNKKLLDKNYINKNYLLNKINNFFYNLIYLTNNNNIKKYYSIIKIIIKFIFIIFINIIISIINIIYFILYIIYKILNIKILFKIYYKYNLFYNYIIYYFYKYNKKYYKTIKILLIFLLFFINCYYYNIIINIIFIIILLNKYKYLYFYLGYIYIFIYDIIILISKKIIFCFFFFLKKTKYILFFLILYKSGIFFVNNENIINLLYFNIKSDIVNIIHIIWNWFDGKPNTLIIEDHKLLLIFLLKQQDLAIEQILSHFKILWENFVISFPKFKWELFTYENIMTKWLNIENIDFITVSLYYLKNIFNIIKTETNLFLDDVKFYIWRFWIMKPLMKPLLMFYYYYAESLLSYYLLEVYINYISLIYMYIYLHFKYIYIYLIPYYFSNKYCYILYNIYSYIYIYYIIIYPIINKIYIYQYYFLLIPLEYMKYILIYIYFIYSNIYILWLFSLDVFNNSIQLLKIEFKAWTIWYMFYYIKFQIYKENLWILLYNIFRFSIYDWNIYEPANEMKNKIQFDFYWNTYYSQEEISKKYEEGNDLSEYNMSALDFFNINPKKTKYWDFSKKWYYIYKDLYDWIENLFLYYNYKKINNYGWCYNIIKYKIVNIFSWYFLLEYIILFFIYIKLYNNNNIIYYNEDYIWKKIKNELDHEIIDNKLMQKNLLLYKKRDKEKEYKINLFIDYLSININKFNNIKKKIIKKNKNVLKLFKSYIKNIKYYYYSTNKINIDNIKNIKKNYKFLKNYIIDKNIYIYIIEIIFLWKYI